MCGSDGRFYCEVMKQLKGLFFYRYSIFAHGDADKISFLYSFDLYLIWDGVLKATEFLKNAPETSDLKFYQYWPMI